MLIDMNNWSQFLTQLLKDFRESTYSLEQKYGVTGFSSKYSSVRSGRSKSISQQTIKDLENALKIKINDSDPDNITYKRIEKEEFNNPFTGAMPVYEYPLLSTVYAGDGTLTDIELDGETVLFAYNKPGHKCFTLRVSGKSMEHTLKDGDVVLVDMDAPLEDGCLVAVKLKNGMQYVKRYKDLNFNFIQLSSDNSAFDTRLIDKNDIVACYRVVQATVNL